MTSGQQEHAIADSGYWPLVPDALWYYPPSRGKRKRADVMAEDIVVEKARGERTQRE